ncbi:glycine betaine/L-proline ABC transporter ATP-binding protein [Aureimonas sp. AU20]|uniref:quaternary amine ABC transporter ATP-binding protein n=1 Tax=Aureimonas sp. AU20 TaxID=1349819 RepID=UPI00071F94DD|nr:betaine/proline/choline family ABC transporter ATP-binding protein [Aureimonas sp. AU20]ALN72073.1 hypothetical protein M673_05060 [Aureimonas sp. AU20]
MNEGASKAEILAETGSVLGLDRVSFSVNEGEILVVMGLSGSGKSTMLRCLNRLVEPTAGSIRVDGTEVTSLSTKALREFRRETFGMVFQHFALFPNRTIAENVEYGLEIQGLDRKTRRERALEAIELVGLKGWDSKVPRQLSGGMQQRAGLARALCADAGILLMDEAFSALDPLIRRDMQNELRALQRKLRKTIVFVSHDLDEAIHLGGRIVLMKDGAIAQSGTAEEILLDPQGEYVRRFVEHIDVSSVVTLGRLVRPQPRLFEGAAAEDAWPLVEPRGGRAEDIFVVTCERDMPVGRIDRNRLTAPASRGQRLDRLMDGGIARAPAGTVLKSVLPLLASEPHGIAVVDDDNRFLGLLTRETALRALSGQRPNEERDTAWNGSSPTMEASANSLWTTSPATPSIGSPSISRH